MSWRIEHQPRLDADRIEAHWSSYSEIYDVSVRSGDGVTRTSFGGSTRAELGAASKPIVGIFRWDPQEVSSPQAILRWRDEPDGDVREQVVHLGR
jgi:hypothetical protein